MCAQETIRLKQEGESARIQFSRLRATLADLGMDPDNPQLPPPVVIEKEVKVGLASTLGPGGVATGGGRRLSPLFGTHRQHGYVPLLTAHCSLTALHSGGLVPWCNAGDCARASRRLASTASLGRQGGRSQAQPPAVQRLRRGRQRSLPEALARGCHGLACSCLGHACRCFGRPSAQGALACP